MNRTFSKIVGLKTESHQVMRCSECHASTPEMRQTPEAAAADWNAYHISDDNFTFASDTKIDRYLERGVKKVLFSDPSGYEYLSTIENEFLCRSAVIVTDTIILSVEPEKSHLLYDELLEYSPDYYKSSITPEETEIVFYRSKWRKRNLLALKFNCGDTRLTIASEAKKGCLIVRKDKRGTHSEADWRYCVAGNITRTHLDEQGVLRYGSSAFRGGTKVYLCGKYWSKEHRTIGTVGMNRYGRYVFSDVPLELIENLRCQKVYKPSVLAIMDNWEFYGGWWDKSAEDKAETQIFVDNWNNDSF